MLSAPAVLQLQLGHAVSFPSRPRRAAPQRQRPAGRQEAALFAGLLGAAVGGRRGRFSRRAVLQEVLQAPSETAPRPERPVAKALKRWLKEKGARGLELVELRSRGVFLRGDQEIPPMSEVLRIPREACITVPLQRRQSTAPQEELAWRLLEERRLGPASAYAPYIDFLWDVDLNCHPVMWGPMELRWLAKLGEIAAAVEQFRDVVAERAASLRARAAAAGWPAPPEKELLFVLCLVESRITVLQPLEKGGPPYAGIVPVLDHMAHDGSGQPWAEAGEGKGPGGPMLLKVLQPLAPGTELKVCFEPLSNIEFFARFGFVPHVLGDEDPISSNVFNKVRMQVGLVRAQKKVLSEAAMQQKLQLLKSRVRVDLRPGAPPEAATVLFPDDLLLKGRLMPLARFLSAVPEPEYGQSEEQLIEELFDSSFPEWRTRRLPPAPPAPRGEARNNETFARQLALGWLQEHIQQLEEVSSQIVEDIKGKVRAEEEKGLEVGLVVKAHYKAKSPDGKAMKSREPKEARVLAIDDENDTVQVQFLANGVRHQVPLSWLARKKRPDDDDFLMGERGVLLLSLIQADLGWPLLVFDLYSAMTETAVELVNAKENGLSREEWKELFKKFGDIWDEEQEMIQRLMKGA